jgi:hypothetical protein
MLTTIRFALAAVVVLPLTACTADPAFATGAGFPGGRGPGITFATPLPAPAPEAKVVHDRVREARLAEFKSSDRPIVRRPRSSCPSCD